MADTHIVVIHDPAPEISASRKVLRRLLGAAAPVIRQGTMRKPLSSSALLDELGKIPEARVVIARNAEIIRRDAGAKAISCVAIAHPVLMTLRAYEHLATAREKREGGEAKPEAVQARLAQMLTDAKPRYPFSSPQAGLFSTDGETLPRAKPLRARDAAPIAKSVEERALILFTDFPAAFARGLQMAAEAGGLDWEPAKVARAAKAAASDDLLKELRAWKRRLGAEVFQRVCDASRADLALLAALFADWKGKAGLGADDAAAIEQVISACAKVTARRKPAAAAVPTQEAA